MAAGLETYLNSINGYNSDISKDLQEFKTQKEKVKKKIFDPLRIHSEQLELEKRSNQKDQLKNNMRDLISVMGGIYFSAKMVADTYFEHKIKTLEEEKQEIEKKLEQEELNPKVKDDQKQELQYSQKKTDEKIAGSENNEKQQLQDRKKKIDEKIAEIEKNKEDLAKKIAEQMLNQHKTSDVIEKTQKLMKEQFKMNCTVQSIAWLYNSMLQVDHAFEDFLKTAFKLILEQKI